MTSKEEALGFQTTDLLPTEKTQVAEIITYMQRKLGKCLTYEKEETKVRALAQWANEAENRFKEIGLVCIVDPYDVAEDKQGNPVLSPEFNITGRLEDVEIDHAQVAHEVQHGLADGRIGKVDLDGRWTDPDVVV